jgi:hypothetical protein
MALSLYHQRNSMEKLAPLEHLLLALAFVQQSIENYSDIQTEDEETKHNRVGQGNDGLKRSAPDSTNLDQDP